MKGISVIIPVFNRDRFLGEAIKSVLSQNYLGPIEIIVSDDGSTDRSLSVASSFGENVRIITKPEGCNSQGVSGTRNRGIAAATQPYIAFLDSDDFYLSNHLNRIAAILESREELGFVFSRMLQMKEQNGRRFFAPWTRSRITNRDILNPVVSGACVVHTNIFLFRRDVFNMVGVFNEQYSNGEDGDLWMRISEGYKGKFADYYGAVYRIEHGGCQLTKSANQSQVQECFKKVFFNALTRCQARPQHNRYRLFRLRLIMASCKTPQWPALIWVAFHHPLLMFNTFLSPARLCNRKSICEWRALDNFIIA